VYILSVSLYSIIVLETLLQTPRACLLAADVQVVVIFHRRGYGGAFSFLFLGRDQLQKKLRSNNSATYLALKLSRKKYSPRKIDN
jgi:hypothetical protein